MASRILRPALLIAAVAIGLISRAADTQEIVGTVVGVTDGDTLTVLDAAKTQHKIRLNGIDAPEASQAFGQRSKEALSAKVFQKAVRVQCHEKDKYGRTIGDIFVADHDINQEMVEEGWAWHYVKYSTSQALAVAEQEARTRKAGLWADTNPIAPWDFRHPVATVQPGSATSSSDSGTQMVYVTKTGKKYHADGCSSLSKSRIPISLSAAKVQYSPCAICKPPQ